MFLFVIGMSLVCTCLSSVCHLYILIRHPYVTRMYSYVIRMSLVCSFATNQTNLVNGINVFMVPFNRIKLNKIWFIVKPQTNDIWITTSEYIRVTYEWHPGDIRMTYDYMQVTYECHTSDIRVHKRHANDIRVHTSDIRVTYECIRMTYRLRISDIRVTYKYIRVTYGWHTSAYEWHTDDIQVTCRLLQLNPRKQEEHLTSQLSWAATWLLVTGVCPFYIVD